MVNFHPPKFSIALCHPRYWSIWAGFFSLAVISNLLPYRLQYFIGTRIGLLSLKLAKSRKHIAERNLELSFPDMSEEERQRLLKENFKNTGFAIFETSMAWFWPNWRLRRHLKTFNIERMLDIDKEKRGALICGVHALNLELTARCCALYSPGYGVYRPNDNPAYDYIQHWGRTRFGNIMVDRKDLKGMLNVLKKGHKLFYLPDHDYGNKNVVFAPFFAVPDASTTAGTGVMVDITKCAVLPVSCFRNGHHYELIIDEDISADFPRRDAIGAATTMNKSVEKIILRGKEQWMWLHKRFKTMSDGSPKGSRYQ